MSNNNNNNNMLNAMNKETRLLVIDDQEFEVTFSYNQSNLNIHVENSAALVGKQKISRAIKEITSWTQWAYILTLGYARSASSMRAEWAAHNLLFDHGYEPERTGSVDLDQNESKLRRFLYHILSWFYKK